MRKFWKWPKAFLVICLSISQAIPPAAFAGEPLQRIYKVLPWSHDDVGRKPHTAQDPCIEELAKNIDWLEGQIDVYGTVVAKAPDIWGEARLTAHRQEFEIELKKELAVFSKTQINGAEFVSDQAFLNFAMAINGQAEDATGRVAAPPVTVNNQTATIGTDPPTAGTSTTTIVSPVTDVNKIFGKNLSTENVNVTVTVEQTEILDQLARYINHLHEIRRINEGDDTSDSPGYAMNLVRIPVSVLPGQRTRNGFGAEITVTAEPYLGPELLPMAFRDLVANDLVDQLSLPMARFINADPADVKTLIENFQANEALPETLLILDTQLSELARVGESILIPSARAKAELTLMSRHPQPDFKFFELNGVPRRDRPLITMQNIKGYLLETKTLAAAGRIDLNAGPVGIHNPTPAQRDSEVRKQIKAHFAESMDMCADFRGKSFIRSADRACATRKTEALMGIGIDRSEINGIQQALLGDPQSINTNFIDKVEEKHLPKLVEFVESRKADVKSTREGVKIANVMEIDEAAVDFLQKLPAIYLPSSTTRKSTLPFPHTQLVHNYGLHELAHLTIDAYNSFRRDVLNREVVHVTDVQAHLREEILAAQELLSSADMQHWWQRGCDQPRYLPEAIRLRNSAEVDRIRKEFIDEVMARWGYHGHAQGPEHEVAVVHVDSGDHSHKKGTAAALFPQDIHATASLAWCVYVESLLLNERLLQDMKETFGNQPNAPCAPEWMAFFGPNPSEEARQAFIEYVKMRWPIRVFALDPVVTEQNIADVRSMYRQMQMSIALAFSERRIGTSAAMQAMRKLQRDRATVDLNRVAVGFGHGDDTFGWRFFPRFQTMPVESNAKVLLRDLVIGGPTDKQLERSREIEPGMRECVAIVLMPSFVPYMTFHTRSDWFKLGCQGRTAVSISDTMQYSRAVKQMETCAQQCIRCPNLYRDGEVDRLLKRVHQLDRKLPLQTMQCQVPIENTHGGFEIFSAGTRELAPELRGWYGAPGYDPENGGHFFLAGDNFSVTGTKVIAGNKLVTAGTSGDTRFELLSRQVMAITLPKNLPIVRDTRLDGTEEKVYQGYLDVHVATPYGVSGHLLIPVMQAKSPSHVVFVPQKVSLSPNADVLDLQLDANYDANGKMTGVAVQLPANPISLFSKIEVPSNLELLLPETKLLVIPSINGDRIRSVEVPLEINAGRQFYEVTATETFSQLDSENKTSLGNAIAGYVYFYLRANNDPRKVEKMKVSATTKLKRKDGLLIDVDGAIVFNVSIKHIDPPKEIKK